MNVGPFQILIIAVVILILFGRGRISEMMGDFGKGVKSFRQGLNEDEEPKAQGSREPVRIEGPVHDAKPAGETVDNAKAADKTVG